MSDQLNFFKTPEPPGTPPQSSCSSLVTGVDQYQELALRTWKDQDQGDALLNCALGLAGEVGELVDHLKKWKFHGHQLDEAYLKKELGDINYYVAVAADEVGALLSEVLTANIAKLAARYPEGFDAVRSINRVEYRSAPKGAVE